MFVICLALALGLASTNIGLSNSVKLEPYGADKTQVSVSGVSSGAAMAVQLHVAFSSDIMGVGAVAGVPYYCARGSYYRATLYECSPNGNTANVDLSYLVEKTTTYATQGKVDATSNLAPSRVYIFRGTKDTIIQQGLAEKLEAYYRVFVTNDNVNIKTVYDIPAGHAFLTENYGSSCELSDKPYINACGYNMAYDILNHIYGNLEKPSADYTATEQVLDISQSEFLPAYLPIYQAMENVGHIYVPSGCQGHGSNCKLHVAIHGCLQTDSDIGNEFWQHTGYNEVAELNNIIILYPQAKNNFYLGNPLGCWDWWGYSQGTYATKQGWEMKAIKGMIDRVLE